MNSIINFEQNKSRIEKAVFDLKLWRSGGRTNFTNQLFDLIAKADAGNRNRLRQAYPTEVFVYEEWRETKSEAEFFKKWGVE